MKSSIFGVCVYVCVCARLVNVSKFMWFVHLAVVLRKRRRRSKVMRQRRPGEVQNWEFRRSPSSKVRYCLWATVLLTNPSGESTESSCINETSESTYLVCVLCRDPVVSGPAYLQQSGGKVTVVCWADRVNSSLARIFTTLPSAGTTWHGQWDAATTSLNTAHSCTQRRWESWGVATEAVVMLHIWSQEQISRA